MRRIILLLAVAALMAAMMAEAGPAGAAAREPTSFDGPGEASDVLPADTVGDTKPAGQNCYGQLASNHVKGPGGDPGSLAVPTEFPAGTPNYTGHAVSTLDPVSQISDFQQQAREDFAGESCDL
jgi:hypothetical protein